MTSLLHTSEIELWAGAEGMDDVDDETVRWGPQWERTRRHQQRHNMEEKGEVARHCKDKQNIYANIQNKRIHDLR